ncbi:phage virion morphogenesis protein [Faecalibacter bovis]|uniref:Phage virion morphogenesis protein n=1 Tax=Faecalibacter bovis TaxID=2898187 RepID=A0ABX7XDR3_9FLAO|nr:phage virion morphogenesis protein [Faecalibacter bovis]QTV06043.1 phage virion morphogenesis protein [Faecalibacter bovis]
MAKTDMLTKLHRLRQLHKRFPELAAIEAVNFSKERFVAKNWLDRSPNRWQPRKKESRGSLMAKTGRLKRSVRKLKTTRNSVTIGTDVPYAQIHNEGGSINNRVNVQAHSRVRKGRAERVKAHTRQMNIRMPKRQFIGESAILLRRIERMLDKQIKEILK